MKSLRLIPAILMTVIVFACPAFATPDISDRTLSDWTGLSTDDPDNDAIGGSEYEIFDIGLFIDDDSLYFELNTNFFLKGTEGGGIEPGDFALDFGGDGTYEFAFAFSDFQLLSADATNASEKSLSYATTLSVYAMNNGDWLTTYNGEPFQASSTASLLGTYTAYYTRDNNYSNDSYDPEWNFIEGAVSLDKLAASLSNIYTSDQVNFYWTMACNNDEAMATATLPATNTNPVPEPATMLLFGSGLLGIAVVCRKRLNTNKTN